MQSAIKKATSVGYKWSGTKGMAEIVLDPLFWQALQRYEMWSDFDFGQTPAWKYYFHRFIDHVIDGGNWDDYFNELMR